MNLLTDQHDRHVEPGNLVRLIDGECRAEEERLAQLHLADCADCRRMADRISRLTGGFDEALFELDDAASSIPEILPASSKRSRNSVPSSWWSRPRLRTAVIVVAVAGLAVLASPARAWVWQAVKSLVTLSVETPPEQTQTTSVVSFVPMGSAFTIDFSNLQAGGTLSIVLDTSAAATTRILGGNGNDRLVVLQSGLSVRNSPESSTSYELRLPSFCESIEVRIGERIVGHQEVQALARRARWVIDLARGDR